MLLVVMFFSLFSGCKLKDKFKKKSNQLEVFNSKQASIASLVKIDSSGFLNLDTSKTKAKETTKKTSKKTYEVVIDLENGANISIDTGGAFDMNKLVNAALKNAKRIQIKAEEQQSQETNKEVSSDNHKTGSGTAVNKANSNTSQISENSKKTKSEKSETAVKTDSTVKTNAGGDFWLWIIIATLVIGFFLIKKFI